MGNPQNEVIIGAVAGTGSAINVSLGFKPRYVKVWNPNDAGSLFPMMEWFEGLTAAYGFKYLKIADNGATGNLSSTLVTSNGISQYAGVAGGATEGFTIGADADINAAGETIWYMAVR